MAKQVASDATLLGKIRRVLPYILNERKSLLVILLVSAVTSGLTILAPWPLKLLVDVALADAPAEEWLSALGLADASDRAIVLLCGAATIGIIISTTLMGSALNWLWAAAGHRMLYALAGDMFSQVQRMSLLYHVRQSAGDLLSRITGDSWCVYSLSARLLVSPTQQILTILGVGAAALAMSPSLTLLIFVLAPAIVLSVTYFGDPIRQRAHGQREAEAALASFSHQTLSNIPLVQVFGLAGRNARIFDILGQRLVDSSQRLVVARDGFIMLNATALAAGSALVLFFGALQVIKGQLSVGSLLVFMAYVQSLRGAVGSLLASFGQLREIEASLDRVIAVLDHQPDVRDKRGAPALHLRHPQGAQIAFENVSFGYSSDRLALRGIDLEIAPQETFAVVGPTGAGKSTLAGLIPRFFDPQEGTVRIDGQRLPDVALGSLRSKISIVLQEPFLLPLTIAENIAFGRPDATGDKVLAAARAANADEFIRKLPQGYDTVLGERGVTLSGGQRQRISIARALTRDAPIVILDEPTSAIDTETEALILEALSRLLAGRTTLIIAHRMSTIEQADRVGFLEDGALVELGTRAELLALNGRFGRFAQLQSVEPREAGNG